MFFNFSSAFVHHSILRGLKAIVISISLLGVGTLHAAIISIPDNSPGHLSTLQVKTAVKKLYKGRIIYAKRTVKPNYPNCHVIKMISTKGVFTYIRYACSG